MSDNSTPVDPGNARLWRRAVAITGPCSCHEGFRSRRLVDPQCMYHELSLDIFEALVEERNLWREAV